MSELHASALSPQLATASGTAPSPRQTARWSIAPRWAALALAVWCTTALNQAWWGKLTALASEQSLGLLEEALVAP